MERKTDKGKNKSKVVVDTGKNLTTLEQICGEDTETCAALTYMFLDPRKIDMSMKQAMDKAEKAENEKDVASARMWYQVAGGVALYEGDVKKTVEYYSDAERVSGQKYLILKDLDKAMAKAQEYYKQYLVSKTE